MLAIVAALLVLAWNARKVARLAPAIEAADNTEMLKQARKVLKPQVEKQGLEWKEVEKLLKHYKTNEELAWVVLNPSALMKQLKDAGGELGRQWLLGQARHVLEPQLHERGLTWEDAKPAIEMIDSVEELRRAAEDPAAFLTNLASLARPIAMRWLLATLRPLAEKALDRKGLEWEDVLAALKLLDADWLWIQLTDPPSLVEKLSDPGAFFETSPAPDGEATGSASPALRRLLIALMRRPASPTVQKIGLEWHELVPFLMQVEASALQKALEDPCSFLTSLALEPSLPLRKMLMARVRGPATPYLDSVELEWEDVLPVRRGM